MRQGRAMTPCAHKAALVITRTADGTSTRVARKRVELVCQLPSGHEERHHDTRHGEHWSLEALDPVMILRHEDEAAP